MRHSQSEKMEIIRIVEQSHLPIKHTLKELAIASSTFYDWYRRFQIDGYDGLTDRSSRPGKIWNRIPDSEKEKVVQIALEHPEKSPRELAWYITDKESYFISESSVYRILKAYDLITSPVYVMLSAADKFKHPTKRVNELWQTDFTYFKIVGWGWYYLSTVLDDYSRYIIAWKLFSTMSSKDVKDVLDLAITKTGVDRIKVRNRPRLLSDNGPCYISKELKEFMRDRELSHIRGQPYHPMTQGKIERFHRSMKNIINLNHYYLPWDLEKEIEAFVNFYNNERYHESINNLRPVDVYNGKAFEILDRREEIKRQTMHHRRRQNLGKESVNSVCI
jgi:transposase InsO family protein/transposase-like protein